MQVLSPVTRARIQAYFREEEQARVERILVDTCTTQLPMAFGDSARFYERIHCAILDLSEGHVDKLERWIAEALIDWRDVLVVAGFADSPTAHLLPRSA